MKKLLQGVFLILRTLIYVILMLIMGTWLFVDLNDFKTDIERLVNKQTGRTLAITGEIKCSFFPELKVTLGKAVLSNPHYFSDSAFAEIAEAEVNVTLMSLFPGKIKVKPVLIRGLKLHLAKNKQGRKNWEGLIQSSAQSGTDHFKQNLHTILALFILDGFKLDQSQISLEDQTTGRNLEFTDLNFYADSLRLDQPIPLLLNFTIHQNSLKLTQNIQLHTDLYVDSALNTLKLKNFKLKNREPFKSIPSSSLSANTLEFQRTEQILTILGVHLQSDPLNLHADLNGKQANENLVLQGHVRIAEFNLKQLLEQWHSVPPVTQDKTAFSRLSAEFELQATQDSAQFKGIHVVMDQTTLKGNAELSDFANPLLQFTMAADKLDLDRYLAPKTGTGAHSAILTPAALAAQAEALWSTIEQSKQMRVKGQLTIQQLTVSQMAMQGITFEFEG